MTTALETTFVVRVPGNLGNSEIDNVLAALTAALAAAMYDGTITVETDDQENDFQVCSDPSALD